MVGLGLQYSPFQLKIEMCQLEYLLKMILLQSDGLSRYGSAFDSLKI